ncbi:TerC family protein [Baaleninema sp.]|uniref:TerC family protein n=1 Tax=Baaleninema sp. TaxID=3101197 RepID=UPI003D085D2D
MLDRLIDISPNLEIEAILILVVLIALEAVLSADNAIALASIASGLEDLKLQRQALNLGLLVAYLLRITLIFAATWVIQFWQFEVAGALYLLWLVYSYFSSEEAEDDGHRGPQFASLWQAIPVIALTDLAFSLDSVTTAIAVSDRLWLVIMGGTIGVITLRFMAGLFIRWLKEYVHLEDAGYLTVGLVGLRLLVRSIDSDIVPPQWMLISTIAIIFVWGFSKRNPEVSLEEETQSE